MKKLTGLLMLCILAYACKNELKKSDRNIVIGDTITTSSGLQYIFLKEGSGRKIEAGSKVSVNTALYLNDSDTIFWTTATAQDSLFSFVHKKSPVIKGFSELHDSLIEGDQVIAILPHTIAYGERGRGTVPPKATLVYNPLTIKQVSGPKLMIADTLYKITKSNSMDNAIQFYESASDSVFHKDVTFILSFLESLKRDRLYTEIEHFAKLLHEKTTNDDDKQNLYYYQIQALESQQKFEEALKVVTPLTQQKKNQEYWKNYSASLKNKLKPAK